MFDIERVRVVAARCEESHPPAVGVMLMCPDARFHRPRLRHHPCTNRVALAGRRVDLRASPGGLCLSLRVRALPADASDLTPAWLSGVLGIEVVDVAVLDRASATNQRVRIGLTYEATRPG